MATTINQLFDNIHNLPQVPNVVRDLITQLSNPHIDMAAIAKNVEKEPTLSLKILRLVNSAHYGLSRKVSSISEALSFLGMSELKTLAIASGFVSAVPDIKGVDITEFWATTFTKAAYAKSLANDIDLDGSIAFTAAIISNIGTILVHLGDSPAALEIDQHVKAGDTARYEFEQRRLGFTSVDVAAELSKRWKFSPELISAIADSATPASIDAPSDIACTVNIAEYLVSHSKSSEDDILENIPFDVTKKLSLSKAVATEKVKALLTIESNLSGLSAS